MKHTFLIFLLINLVFPIFSQNTYASESYKFVQYVKLQGDKKEIKASEGLIYITEEEFSEKETMAIKNNNLINSSLKNSLHSRNLLNTCISIKPLVSTEHNRLASYVPLAMTRSRISNQSRKMPVYDWVDWRYTFKIEFNEEKIMLKSVGGKRGFEYESERFDIQKVEGLNLENCLNFRGDNK